jgi:hypothetical protein
MGRHQRRAIPPDAARAEEIQRAMADRDLDLAQDRRLRFRIGLISATWPPMAATFAATASYSSTPIEIKYCSLAIACGIVPDRLREALGLAAAQPLHPKRGAHNPKPIDLHYDAIQAAMKGVFHELGLAA